MSNIDDALPISRKDLANTPTVIESGSNANGRYRKWSDGLIEQWGVGTCGNTVSLPTNFSNTNYIVIVSPNEYGHGMSFGSKGKTVSSFTPTSGWTCEGASPEDNSRKTSVSWFAKSL